MPRKADSLSPARDRFRPTKDKGLRLEARDRSLLVDLFLHRAMNRSQIQRLYFGSVPRCNARLRQLFDHGYVQRHFGSSAPYGAQAVYTAGKSAVSLLASELEMDAAEVKRLCRPGSPTFLEHTSAVVELYLTLKSEVEKHPDLTLERWLPELLCRHEYEIRSDSGKWRTEIFNPDGFVRLATADRTLHPFFLEVDLGHTASRQFAHKIALHRRYADSGIFTEMYGCDRFVTLVVTTGDRRLKHLLSIADEMRNRSFWLSTFQAAEELGLLAAIWHVPGSAEPRPLVDLSERELP